MSYPRIFPIVAWFCWMALVCTGLYADTLFEDNFNNSNPTDVNGENPDFWTKNVPSNSLNGTLTESGSGLSQTIGSSNFQGGNHAVQLFSNQKSPNDTFNFFVPHANPKTFSGRVSLTSNCPNFWDNVLRISLVSENSEIYLANDGLSLRFRGGKDDATKLFDVYLGYKINAPNRNPEGSGTGVTTLVNNGIPGNANGYSLYGTLTGYDLELDESNYALAVHYTNTSGVPTSQIWSGPLGTAMTKTSWGDGSGNSMLQMEHRMNMTIGDRMATAAWTELAMTTANLFEDGFNDNAPATVSGEIPAYWTTSVPSDSRNGSLSENADGLQQVIGGPNYQGGNQATLLYSNQKNPSDAFNFFVPSGQGKTLRGIVSLASTFPNMWENVLRISLVSENSEIYLANDGLSLRFRGGKDDATKQFDVYLGYKINAPNRNPEGSGTGVTTLVNNGIPGNVNGYSLYGTLTGYALTLDQSNYTLIVYYTNTSGVATSQTWSGSFGSDMTQANWGDGSGKSMLQLEHRANTTAGDKQSIATWKYLAMKGGNGTPTLLMFDDCNNGNPTKISSENPDFWTKSLPEDSRNGTLTEASNGSLNQIVGSSNFQGGNQAVLLYSNQKSTHEAFNFFVPAGHAKTLSGSLSLTSNCPNFWDNVLRISLVSENSEIYLANDGLSLRFRGGKDDATKQFDVYLGYKINAPNRNPEGSGTGVTTLVNNGIPGNVNGYSLYGTLTGYALTLDQSNYTLIVYYTNTSGVATSQTWSGSFGSDMTRASWGDGSGKSMLQLEHRLNMPIGNRMATALWTHLSVDGQPWTVQSDDDWRSTDLSDLIIQAGSALDMSFLQDAPAGKYGFATINSSGELVFADRPTIPVRLLCDNHNIVHISETLAPFTSTQISAFVAQESRLGNNILRPHNLDAFLMKDATQNGFLNAAQLDKWDQLSHELKQQGIYLFLDLTTYASYSKTNYWTQAGKDERLRSRIYWQTSAGGARDIWQTGVTNLLNHVNPYSGLALKNEPQVLLMQTRNEANLLKILQDEAASGYAMDQGMIDMFRSWLMTRYGAISVLNAAWGTSYTSFTGVPFPNVNVYSGAVAQDLLRFCVDSDQELFLWMKGILDGLNVQVPLTDFNYISSYNQSFTREILPLVDMHAYHEHPSNYDSPGSYQRGLSALDTRSYLNYLCAIASTRQLGRPITVSEIGQPYWNAWRMESGLLWPSIAALQGWSMVSQFSHIALLNSTNSRCYPLRPFLVGIDPANFAGHFMAAMLYARGDVAPSGHIIEVNLDPATITLANNAPWSMDGLPRLAMLSRFGVNQPSTANSAPRASYTPNLSLTATSGSQIVYINGAAYTIESGDYSAILAPAVASLRSAGVLNASNQTNIANHVYQSDTNQILIQMQNKRVEIKTSSSEGGTLLPGASMALNVMTSATNSSKIPVALFLGSLNGPLDPATGRMLLIVASDALNTNSIFKSKDRQELVSIGQMPVLSHVVNVHLRVAHSNPSQLRLWALGFNGSRLTELPLTVGSNYVDIDIDTSDMTYFPNGPTPFFELVVNDSSGAGSE